MCKENKLNDGNSPKSKRTCWAPTEFGVRCKTDAKYLGLCPRHVNPIKWAYWKRHKAYAALAGLLASVISLAPIPIFALWLFTGTNELPAASSEESRATFVAHAKERKQVAIAEAETEEDLTVREKKIDLAEARYQKSIRIINEVTGENFDPSIVGRFTGIEEEKGKDAAIEFLQRRYEKATRQIFAENDVDQMIMESGLAPALMIAKTFEAAGENVNAEEIYVELIKRAPMSHELVMRYGRYLLDRSDVEQIEFLSLDKAFETAEQLVLIVRTAARNESLPVDDELFELLSDSYQRLGEVSDVRGEPGDTFSAENNFAESLKVRRAILQANPSTRTRRNVSIAATLLASVYIKRGEKSHRAKVKLLFEESRRLREINHKAPVAEPADGALPGVDYDELFAVDYAVILARIASFNSEGDMSDEVRNDTERMFREAYEVLGDCIAKNPKSRNANKQHAVVCEKFGDYCRDKSTESQSSGYYLEAIDCWRALAAEHPKSLEYSLGKCVAINRYVVQELKKGTSREKLATLVLESVATSQAIYNENKQSNLAIERFAQSLSAQGQVDLATMSKEDATVAIPKFQFAVEILKPHYGKNENNLRAKRLMAYCESWLSKAHSMRNLEGDQDTAIDLAMSAKAHFSELEKSWVPGTPPEDVVDDAHAFATVSLQLGRYLRLRNGEGDFAAAMAVVEAARKLLKGLLVRNPNSTVTKSSLVTALTALGELMILTGDAVHAEDHLQESVELAEDVLNASPESDASRRQIAIASYWLGMCYQFQKRMFEANKSVDRCFDILVAMEEKGRPMDAPVKNLLKLLKKAKGIDH